MDDEELGQSLGYAQWAEEICTETQRDEGQKKEYVQSLKSNKASGFAENKETIKQLHEIIRKKQVQRTAMKGEVYDHIQKTIAEKIPYFEDMHAELFAREIANAVQHVHQQTIILSDVLLRQQKLLAALNQETFEDLVSHVLFLCEKEVGLKGDIERKTVLLYQNMLKLIEHMSSNYFVRLAKLAETKEFHEDHHDLFMGTYLLSTLARTIIKAEGLDVSEMLEKELQFTKNLVTV